MPDAGFKRNSVQAASAFQHASGVASPGPGFVCIRHMSHRADAAGDAGCAGNQPFSLKRCESILHREGTDTGQLRQISHGRGVAVLGDVRSDVPERFRLQLSGSFNLGHGSVVQPVAVILRIAVDDQLGVAEVEGGDDLLPLGAQLHVYTDLLVVDLGCVDLAHLVI